MSKQRSVGSLLLLLAYGLALTPNAAIAQATNFAGGPFVPSKTPVVNTTAPQEIPVAPPVQTAPQRVEQPLNLPTFFGNTTITPADTLMRSFYVGELPERPGAGEQRSYRLDDLRAFMSNQGWHSELAEGPFIEPDESNAIIEDSNFIDPALIPTSYERGGAGKAHGAGGGGGAGKIDEVGSFSWGMNESAHGGGGGAGKAHGAGGGGGAGKIDEVGSFSWGMNESAHGAGGGGGAGKAPDLNADARPGTIENIGITDGTRGYQTGGNGGYQTGGITDGTRFGGITDGTKSGGSDGLSLNFTTVGNAQSLNFATPNPGAAASSLNFTRPGAAVGSLNFVNPGVAAGSLNFTNIATPPALNFTNINAGLLNGPQGGASNSSLNFTQVNPGGANAFGGGGGAGKIDSSKLTPNLNTNVFTK